MVYIKYRYTLTLKYMFRSRLRYTWMYNISQGISLYREVDELLNVVKYKVRYGEDLLFKLVFIYIYIYIL